MKFKLDENFGTRALWVFEDAGHDAQTVRQESLQGASDRHLYEICCEEQRCLVTLDLDFANPMRFPPEEAGGIVVVRLRRNPSLALLERSVRQFLRALGHTPLQKSLWIVEVGRIRIHQSDADPEQSNL